MLNTIKLSITPMLTVLYHRNTFYKSTSIPYRLYVGTYRFSSVWIFCQSEKLSIDVSFSSHSWFHIIIASRPSKLFFFTHAQSASYTPTFRLLFVYSFPISTDPHIPRELLQICGLTRTKVVTVWLRSDNYGGLHSSPNHDSIRFWQTIMHAEIMISSVTIGLSRCMNRPTQKNLGANAFFFYAHIF